MDAMLSVFGSINMRLPFLPLLGAADASSVYGHGGAIASMGVSQILRVAHLCAKAGEHVTLAPSEDLKEPPDNLGPRHDLGLHLGDFHVVFSVRVTSPDHINLEEGRALIRYLKWLVRSRRRFHHRVVVLLDSRVVIGAATKGRSSSMPLNLLCKRLAALTFATDILLHLVFIPTAHNPSDWPSRGGPSTWPHCLQSRKQPKALRPPQHSVIALDQAWQRLRSTGMVSSDDECI